MGVITKAGGDHSSSPAFLRSSRTRFRPQERHEWNGMNGTYMGTGVSLTAYPCLLLGRIKEKVCTFVCTLKQ